MKAMTNRLCVWTASTIVGFLAASAWSLPSKAAEPAFSWSKPIDLPKLDGEDLVTISLDEDVYRSTRDGLPDLRIVTATGETIPFLSRHAVETETRLVRHNWKVGDISAEPREDGTLVIEVQLKKDAPKPTGLRLNTPLHNYRHRVRVEASDDSNEWKSLSDDGLIFDYSAFIDASNNTVSFAETPLRRFRIRIENNTSEQESRLLKLTRESHEAHESGRKEQVVIERRPLRIDSIEFFRDDRRIDSTTEKARLYPLDGFKVVQNEDSQHT